MYACAVFFVGGFAYVRETTNGGWGGGGRTNALCGKRRSRHTIHKMLLRVRYIGGIIAQHGPPSQLACLGLARPPSQKYVESKNRAFAAILVVGQPRTQATQRTRTNRSGKSAAETTPHPDRNPQRRGKCQKRPDVLSPKVALSLYYTRLRDYPEKKKSTLT